MKAPEILKAIAKDIERFGLHAGPTGGRPPHRVCVISRIYDLTKSLSREHQRTRINECCQRIYTVLAGSPINSIYDLQLLHPNQVILVLAQAAELRQCQRETQPKTQKQYSNTTPSNNY